MRRVVRLLAIAMLTSACAAPAPSATPQLASLLPTAASAPALTTSPSPVETPDATASLAPSATPLEVIPEESPAPTLEVDFDAAPTFPSPVLVAGKTRTRAIGEAGCPLLVYEPADDPMNRSTGHQGECVEAALALTKPVLVAAGAPLVFRAPKGWELGAQVAFSTDPYGPFWIIEATSVSASSRWRDDPVGFAGDGWEEIARGEGFRLNELDALAPVVPGDYLVSVQSQVGQVPAMWRTYDRTYYYWIRVR